MVGGNSDRSGVDPALFDFQLKSCNLSVCTRTEARGIAPKGAKSDRESRFVVGQEA